MSKERMKYKCMKCESEMLIDKWHLKDSMSCPACRGPMKVVSLETVNVYADGEEAINIAEATKAALISNNLLLISLESETSVPKVFYQGEEITHKQNVFFEWDTDKDIMGGLTYSIEHADLGKGYPVTNRIERKVKGHACN